MRTRQTESQEVLVGGLRARFERYIFHSMFFLFFGRGYDTTLPYYWRLHTWKLVKMSKKKKKKKKTSAIGGGRSGSDGEHLHHQLLLYY